MGLAVFEEEVSFLSQQAGAAAVICRTSHGNFHIGVLHRDKDGGAAILHLAWKDKLSWDWGEPPTSSSHALVWRRLWAVPEVEPERLTSVGGYCRLIWKRYKKNQNVMPYRINVGRSKFNGDGSLHLGEGAKGLTCASFVLAVFESVGVTLLDETSFPVRKDDDQKFLDSVRPFANPRHFKLLSEEVAAGCRRVQPQEVMAACALQPVATFSQLEVGSWEVLGKLEAARPVPAAGASKTKARG